MTNNSRHSMSYLDGYKSVKSTDRCVYVYYLECVCLVFSDYFLLKQHSSIHYIKDRQAEFHAQLTT